MYVSAEIMTIVLSAVGIVVATVTSMFSGLVWIVRRMDAMEQRLIARIEMGEARLEARIDKVEARIDKVEARIDRLDARIASVEREVADIRATIAKWEGPYPRLVLSR